MLGGFAAYVAYHAPCPVLLVHPRVLGEGVAPRDQRQAETIAGALLVEPGHQPFGLAQVPLDDEPSVYRETIVARGFGFHHFGVAHRDVEAELLRYLASGWREAFRAAVPTGGEVVYLEGGSSAAPGFLELLPATPGMDAAFTGFWRAAQGWDGTDPVRPFA